MNILRSLKAIGAITPPDELIETVESKDIPQTKKAAVETQSEEKAADLFRARLVKRAAEEPALETQAAEEPALETQAEEAPALETQAEEKPALETQAVEAPALETQAVEAPALETQTVEEPADTEATLKLEEGLREIKEVVMRLENTLEQVLGSEPESEPESEFTRLILDTVRKEVRKEVDTVLRTFRTLPEGWNSSNGESSDA